MSSLQIKGGFFKSVPFSWPGGSMVVDLDGKILAQTDPNPGEKIVVAPVDINNLRYEESVD